MKARLLGFLLIGLLLAVPHARALSTVVEIKPGKSPGDKIEAQGFTFEIKADPAVKGEIHFHVTITEGRQKFAVDNPMVSLSELTILKDAKGNPAGLSLGKVGLKPKEQFDAKGTGSFVNTGKEITIPAVNAKRVGNTLTCDFVMPETLLADPDVGLVFTNPVFVTLADGSKRGMPSATMYFVRLKDFSPAATSASSPQPARP